MEIWQNKLKQTFLLHTFLFGWCIMYINLFILICCAGIIFTYMEHSIQSQCLVHLANACILESDLVGGASGQMKRFGGDPVRQYGWICWWWGEALLKTELQTPASESCKNGEGSGVRRVWIEALDRTAPPGSSYTTYTCHVGCWCCHFHWYNTSI